ncbi:MAG: HAD-IA family hydrolase [Anaerolineaceae bacterium]|nr:HAD-IA family hydrolase [Anaerolineaceae bacterium]
MIHKQPVLPGVVEYISSAENFGLKIGLASSSPREWVIGHLSRVNLISRFSAICGAEDVQEVKPDPSLYQCAIKKLGIQGSRAIAIEDSHHGVMAAKAAGLFCVAVPNEITRQMDFSNADMILEELTQIPLREIIRRFDGK